MNGKNSINLIVVIVTILAIAAIIALVAYGAFSMPLPDGLTEPASEIDVENAGDNQFQDLMDYVEITTISPDDDYDSTVAKIDWAQLESIYPNIIGWACCPGTAVNTPILYYRSKNDVPSDENAFYVITDKDAVFSSENVILYAPNMNFSAYTKDEFTAEPDASTAETYPANWVISLKTGALYDAYFWNVSSSKTFDKFSIETRNFKNLFEKGDWMAAALDSTANPNVSYLPDEIQPLLTVVPTNGGRYSVFFELSETIL